MSYADKIFVDMCRNILDNGTDTKGEKVRPKWDDGSFAYTIKKFGVVNRYDLKKEFPAITLRKTGFKNCLDVHQVEEREQAAERVPESGVGKHITGTHFAVVGAVMHDLSLSIYLVETAWKKHGTV